MKVSSAMALVVLGIALMACHHEEKSEHCTYNDREIPCDQMPKGSTPSTSSSNEQCLNNAFNFLSSDQATQACTHANKYSVKCMNEARIGLSNEDIVAVCSRATANSVTCIRNQMGRASSSEVVAHCK